ncbi:two-component system, OmpR family, sensor histidine kinase SenX3 [Tessaracoccus bendigoensis DSM 12906]|uniref:Sensor-like histidine kinase SenX3 n=1 Tax=Tessaracoccus bendigoensis DSM 12906 TaxID=1123357 RepID=A0A1M6A4V2_9ACTN|nr:ATP-binding protein [Tessaracoccus bendigoensis]SHI31498.1 two-component system, OmpR family, sensor histidine kinase SenX3 [Tessaracoccus bendigoensis DSM 12906]
MHPALAGLIGAGVALLGCYFVYLMYRGKEGWRQLEARRNAELVSRELRDVLAIVPSGVVMVGPDDEILVSNDQATALNLARGNRVGFPELLDRVREARMTGVAFQGTIAREMLPGAHAVELEARIAPFDDERVLVLADDESSQRRVDAVRRDFVANISHELKTPIGAVSVLAEAVEAARDDPDAVRRFATKLQIETARLAELINQIIDLSRLQSEDPMLASEVIDVNEVVTDAVSRSKELATQREVSLILARTSDAFVLGDRWQLTDAVANLVQNAINYSDERARVTISVALTERAGDQNVEIKVSDNGIGIKAEEQERIFERFYRVDYGRSRSTGGTGLGLSIVRHIAIAHGGSVRVWSRPGQGSTFTISLPTYLGPAPEPDSGGDDQ